MKIYQKIAHLLQAIRNCEKSGNSEWETRHRTLAERIARECLPSGSGFDQGTKVDFERSNAARIVLKTSFHHMDENGFYCGWTEHDVIVSADLAFDFVTRITGRDKRNIKEYIGDTFNHTLDEECPDWADWS